MKTYEKVIKEFLKEEKKKRIQMFDCSDIMGDYKITLYEDEMVEILYAPNYGYIEVIGLNSRDYDTLFKKYGY